MPGYSASSTHHLAKIFGAAAILLSPSNLNKNSIFFKPYHRTDLLDPTLNGVNVAWSPFWYSVEQS
jgi:hypothetical protein